MVREQPDPLSPRIAQEKNRVVRKLNAYLFPDDEVRLERFTKLKQTVFGSLIAQQTALESRVPKEVRPELDNRRWPNWSEIKPLLNEVEQREPNTKAEGKAQKATYRQLNRLLLEAYFGDDISKKTRVLRPVVIWHDQVFRLILVASLATAFVLGAWLVRVNSTSLHHYYRAQLSQAYLGVDPARADEDNGSQRLSRLDTVSHGGPYHLIGAALNISTLRELMLKAFGASKSGDQRETSAAIGGTDAFVFSHQFCGSDYTGFEATPSFEAKSRVRVADGVALSGAAVSLTQIGNPLILLFMAALNLRLGQWLPRPDPQQRSGGQAKPPNLLELLRERSAPDSRRHFFVTDGGHHDNLGLGVLLRRHCRLIIISDATCDPNYEFADFLRVWRREYRDHGIRILVEPSRHPHRPSGLDQVRPQNLCADRPTSTSIAKPDTKEKSLDSKTADAWSSSHYFVGQIEYPGVASDADQALLIYLKPSMTGDEPQDLQEFWATNAAFPHDPTSNQFYDENLVESYRQLGEHVGEQLCQELARAAGVQLWKEDYFGIHEWVNHWAESLQTEDLHGGPPADEATSASEY
jgi:hypothetical protein